MRNKYGRRHGRPSADPSGSAGDRREGERKVRGAVESGDSENGGSFALKPAAKAQGDVAATKKHTTEPWSHGEKQKIDGFVPDRDSVLPRPNFCFSRANSN